MIKLKYVFGLVSVRNYNSQNWNGSALVAIYKWKTIAWYIGSPLHMYPVLDKLLAELIHWLIHVNHLLRMFCSLWSSFPYDHFTLHSYIVMYLPYNMIFFPVAHTAVSVDRAL